MTVPATFHDLQNASVFITGGGSGIGAALTCGFLAQGAKVAFIDIADCAEFVAKATDQTGRTPLFIQGDVTDIAALRGAIDTAAEAHGPVTVLVNNAANDMRCDLEDVTEEFWRWMIDINLKAYYFAAQAVAPGMQAAGGGAIVNFSSVSYMMGLPELSVYTTANGGITAMTRSLARALGPNKIRVNAIAPGWVLTDKQLYKWATPEGLQGHMDQQALKEHMVPDDMVVPVLFLASQASRMMTGQCMVVDGGVATTG